MENGEGMSDLIKRDYKTLPDTIDELKKYVEIGKQKIRARRALIVSLQEAEADWHEAMNEAIDEEYWTWKAHALIGEKLGSGEEAMKAGVENPSTLLEGLDHHARFFARRYWDAEQKGILDELLIDMKKVLTLYPYGRPIKGAHVQGNSEDSEWYTPIEFIELARAVMGEIDLDPASNETANTIVQAKKIYTIANDGLNQSWEGRIWMNPPYDTDLIWPFCDKLVREFFEGNVFEAIALVNNATETRWFQSIGQAASAVCFPLGRVKFWRPDKKSAPLQGQAVLYLGANNKLFCEVWRGMGLCLMNFR